MKVFIFIWLNLPVVFVAQLKVEFRWGNKKILPESTYYYKQDSIKFEELKTYLSDVYLVNEKERKKIADVILVNFVDTISNYAEIEFDVNASNKLEFNFGLDSIYHVNMNYSGALDPIHGMYWAWNTGYINFKMVARSFGRLGNKLIDYHLGGYLKPHNTMHELEFKLIGTTLYLDLLPLFEKEIIRPEIISSVLMPGKEASRLMKSLSTAFSYD